MPSTSGKDDTDDDDEDDEDEDDDGRSWVTSRQLLAIILVVGPSVNFSGSRQTLPIHPWGGESSWTRPLSPQGGGNSGPYTCPMAFFDLFLWAFGWIEIGRKVHVLC